MIFNCIIRLISINFSLCMHCKIPKDCGTLCQQQVLVSIHTSFMVWDFAMLVDVPMDVFTDSLMSVSTACTTGYWTVGNQVAYSLIIVVTHSTFGINSIFLLFWLGNSWCRSFGLVQL